MDERTICNESGVEGCKGVVFEWCEAAEVAGNHLGAGGGAKHEVGDHRSIGEISDVRDVGRKDPVDKDQQACVGHPPRSDIEARCDRSRRVERHPFNPLEAGEAPCLLAAGRQTQSLEARSTASSQLLQQIGRRRCRDGGEGVLEGHRLGGGGLGHAPAAWAGSTSSHS
jgi:hypothetical protein